MSKNCRSLLVSIRVEFSSLLKWCEYCHEKPLNYEYIFVFEERIISDHWLGFYIYSSSRLNVIICAKPVRSIFCCLFEISYLIFWILEKHQLLFFRICSSRLNIALRSGLKICERSTDNVLNALLILYQLEILLR